MGPQDIGVVETGSTSELEDQPFAKLVMGDSLDSDLLPELSGETWVAATDLDEATSDLPPSASEPDLTTSYILDKTLTIVRAWVRAGAPGRTVQDYPRSYVRCISNSATCQLIWTSTVASPCTPGDGVTTGGAIGRASGVYPPIS